MSRLLHAELRGGRGRPGIVFFHGFLGSGADWRELAERLSDEFCCALIDLPGHGGSVNLPRSAYRFAAAAQRAADTVRALNLLDPAAVGYSMGGRVALRILCEVPDLFSAAIIESAHPGLEEPRARAERRRIDRTLASRLEREPLAEFLECWYRQPLFKSLHRRPGRLATTMARRRLQDPAELARALRGLSVSRQDPLWDRLRGVKVPVLWIAGALDEKYARIAQRAAARTHAASVRIIADAGHNVHVERPTDVEAAVRRFLAGD